MQETKKLHTNSMKMIIAYIMLTSNDFIAALTQESIL